MAMIKLPFALISHMKLTIERVTLDQIFPWIFPPSGGSQMGPVAAQEPGERHAQPGPPPRGRGTRLAPHRRSRGRRGCGAAGAGAAGAGVDGEVGEAGDCTWILKELGDIFGGIFE